MLYIRGSSVRETSGGRLNCNKERGVSMDNRIKIAAIAALLSCSAAYAGDPAQPSDTMAKSLPEFSTLDVNADGAISAEEAKGQADLTAVWADVDADKNGKLSSKEYAEAKARLSK
jgi:hypothetical protein